MKALKVLDLDNVVFIDIETVAGSKTITPDDPMWASWSYKMKFGREPLGGDDVAKSFTEQASLFAEFGKIVCITIGKIVGDKLKLKSYVNDDEKILLTEFSKTLTNIIAANKQTVLCGHAIKGFDLPWIMRRSIINQVPLPSLVDTAHLKPWETTAVDTMDLWKGTGFNGGSLIAIAVAMGLLNPKDDIAGYQTTDAYYNQPNGLERIRIYCEKDVTTVANVVRMCRYEPLIQPESSDLDVKPVGVLQRTFNTKTLTKEDQKAIIKLRESLPDGERKIADDILSVAVPKK